MRAIESVLILLLTFDKVIAFQILARPLRCTNIYHRAYEKRRHDYDNSMLMSNSRPHIGKWKIRMDSSVQSESTILSDICEEKSSTRTGFGSEQLIQLRRFDNFFPVISGVILAFSLLFSIAMIGENVTFTSWKDIIENVQLAYRNMYDAIAPLGISDIISIIVGESTAAFIAALSSGLILISWKLHQLIPKLKSKTTTDVVADGDFLLTKTAALSVFTVIGISPALAKVFSIVLGFFRYGIVKVGARRREQIVEEEIILNELLEEHIRQNDLSQVQSGLILSKVSDLYESNGVVATESLVPVQQKKSSTVDFVEIFSDVTKWLQYDVLKTQFEGSLSWDDQLLYPGLECALFGAISCLLAQSYCDILHAYFNIGGSNAGEKVKTRSFIDWVTLYLYQVIYGAALFVTYEAAQIPATWILNAFLSGGVHGCIGSSDYSGCIETFIELNSPEDTPEEEIYSRITPIVDVYSSKISFLYENFKSNFVSPVVPIY